MSNKLKTKDHLESYAYGKAVIPFPEVDSEKVAPPAVDSSSDTSKLFAKKELTPEEQAIEYMSTYKRFERVIVCNFYIGGGRYTRGILDSIYKGFNPLNP